MLDSPKRDPSVLAYKRRMRLIALETTYSKAGDREKVRVIEPEVNKAIDDWEAAIPTSLRGVQIKATRAIRFYLEQEEEGLAGLLRDFFRIRNKDSGEWLRDLRTHIEVVKRVASESDHGVTYLKSIVAGMSRPVLLN